MTRPYPSAGPWYMGRADPPPYTVPRDSKTTAPNPDEVEGLFFIGIERSKAH